MKKFLFTNIAIFLFLFSSCSSDEMLSPNGKIKIELQSDESGILKYIVKKGDTVILEPSALGLIMEDADFTLLEIVRNCLNLFRLHF